MHRKTCSFKNFSGLQSNRSLSTSPPHPHTHSLKQLYDKFVNFLFQVLRMSSESRRNVTRLHCLSILGVSYAVVVTGLIFLTGVICILPVVYHDSAGVLWSSIAIAIYLFAGIVTNFIMVYCVQSYVPTQTPGSLPGPGWSHCDVCDQTVPPRSHHCVLCQRCILGRDHHCFFTGSCVGKLNHRYFVLFCMYCGIGSAYSLYVNTVFLSKSYVSPISAEFYHFILPLTFLEWVFGFQTLGFLYFAFVWCVSLCTMFGALGVTVWQIFVLSRGQTSFEYINGRTSNSVDVLRNLRTIFGPYWCLQFLFPFPLNSQLSSLNLSKIVQFQFCSHLSFMLSAFTKLIQLFFVLHPSFV